MKIRLFHFSDDNSITRFEPRSVRIPSQRSIGNEWHNGPLVWAIDDWHQPLYLFPRDCPRIIMWRTSQTIADDSTKYFSNTTARMIAYIEKDWESKIRRETLYRYELPASFFKSLNDAGMWVSDTAMEPIEKISIDNLPLRLEEKCVELRTVDRLTPLKGLWNSTLHVSGIRLRNARDWVS